MYVKDMSMAEATYERGILEDRVRVGRRYGRDTKQLEWDLEDVNGRIDELTDWY